MTPDQLQNLADKFTRVAMRVQPGDHVWVEFQGREAMPLAEYCVSRITEIGAHARCTDVSAAAIQAFMAASDRDALVAHDLEAMKAMQSYLRIKDDGEIKKLPLGMMAAYNKILKPLTNHRVNNTRWLLVASPSEYFRALTGKDRKTAHDFYYDVNMLDYARMKDAAQPLVDLMSGVKSVHIKGRDTNLRFNTIAANAVPCVGYRNLPDGEVYTAPARESVNGHIRFTKPFYNGKSFETVALEFKNGKAINAVAETPEQTALLNAMLDDDTTGNGRYIGEFALAFNPYVRDPIGMVLFDEKIAGSIHLAMGDCYDATPNGNKSTTHWDMIHIQRPEYGGGEIWFDEKLVRKNGIFVTPELRGLNPDRLTGPSV